MNYAKLRDYQDLALTQTVESWRTGHRKVLLHMDTGLGKTVIFATAMKRACENNRRSIMTVRGRQLVNQASERLFRENTPHGVLMAGHPLYRPWEKIQIASIDTVRSRGIYPKADLVVIDEAHLATSDPWHEFVNNYPNAFFLSVTATPYGPKSLEHLCDTVIRPIEFREAVSEGYIVDAKYYVPSQPDLTGIRIQNGDYHKGQLEEVCNTGQLVGNIVDTWIRLSLNKPTICFAVSIAHSLEIVSQFKKAGINAIHIEARTKDKDRKDAIRRLENGDIKIISNVGILCTGVDVPCLRTIIGARPTKSYSLYVQQLGRGTRPFNDKSNFTILDHAGNVIRHGFLSDQPNACIDGKRKKEIEFKRTAICKICFLAYQSAFCPMCGKQPANTSGGNVPETADGELVEFESDTPDKYLQSLKRTRELRDYNKKWIWHRMKERFGEAVADEKFPVKKGTRIINARMLKGLTRV